MSALVDRVAARIGTSSPSPARRPVHASLWKTSKSMLRSIAPLHPNRRTPPPAVPRLPAVTAPKKTRKMEEMEERIEEELEEEVEGWFAMSEGERAVLRRRRRDEMLGVED